MAYLDAVLYRAASNGTGDFVPASAIQGYRLPITAGAVDGLTYYYRAESDDLTQWEYGYTVGSSTATSFTRVVVSNSLGTTAKINFTVAPKVGFTDISALILSFDSAMSLTATQKEQGRANLAVGALGLTNRVINPSGQVNQAPNFAGTGTAADGTYWFDQWVHLNEANPVTPSQILNAENGTPFMIRTTQSNASAQRLGIIQPLESCNVLDLRGKTVTLSARVRCSAATTLRFAIVEWTGTADSPTKDVVNNWASGTYTAGNFFISTTTTVVAVGSLALTAATLTDVSLSGAVSGSMNNLHVFFWTESTQAQNVTLDVGKVQLEQGAVATRLAFRSYQEELLLCQRYMEIISGGAYSGAAVYINWSFKAVKRASPTVALNPAPNLGMGVTVDGFYAIHNAVTTFSGFAYARL